MKKALLISGVALTLLFACQNKSHQADDHNTETLPNAAQQDSLAKNHEKLAEHPVVVELNNGQKWAANKETTEGIKAMGNLVAAFPKEPSNEDYSSLKASLGKEFDTILQKCTMTGEAHNQLHNYLLPMKEMIEKLGSSSADQQKDALNMLKLHIKEYDVYFQ